MDGTPTVTAFLLVSLAGLSTVIGACTVFLVDTSMDDVALVELGSGLRPSKVAINPIQYASALGLGSGAMIYIAFVELFQESIAAFSGSYASYVECKSYVSSTVGFLSGWYFATWLKRLYDYLFLRCVCSGESSTEAGLVSEDPSVAQNGSIRASMSDLVSTCLITAESDEVIHHHHFDTSDDTSREIHRGAELDECKTKIREKAHQTFVDDHFQVLRTGAFAAIVITIHNIPEGFAYFTAARHSHKLGITMAISIVIHNIPAGFAIAVPIFATTGSRTTAIGVAALAGLAELLGALIAWPIQYNMSDWVLGSVFSLIAGVMVYVAISDLFLTAMRYDPTDRVTVTSMIIGMAIMSSSLVTAKYDIIMAYL